MRRHAKAAAAESTSKSGTPSRRQNVAWLGVVLAAALLVAQTASAAQPPRVYEQVTPSSKNGALWGATISSSDLVNNAGPAWAVARTGDRLVVYSTSPIGSTEPASWAGVLPTLIQRTVDGWRSTALPPSLGPPTPTITIKGVLGQPPLGYTDDFSTLAFVSSFQLSSRDRDDQNSQTEGNDIYIYRPGAGFQLASCPPAPGGSVFPPNCSALTATNESLTGINVVSADGSTVAFEADEAFLDGAGQPLFPGALGPQVYANHDDILQWVSAPLDTVPSGATQVSGPPSIGLSAIGDDPVSADGSRVFFAAGSPQRVYVRVDNQRTLEVSRVRGGSESAEEVGFRGASADGNRALISTAQALLPGSVESGPGVDPNSVKDFYLWSYQSQADPANDDPDALTRLAGLTQVGAGPSPDGEEGAIVLGYSPDLTQVYFSAGPNLYLAELPAVDPAAGTVRWIATVGSPACLSFSEFEFYGVPAICARTSPDGRYLAFESPEQLTSGDIDASTDVYLFDSESNTLENTSGGDSGGDGAFDATLFGDTLNLANTQHVTNSGQVFFITDEALSGADVNSKQDVYGATAGDPSAELISGGFGPFNTLFGGMSNEGRDVYLVTVDALDPKDTDGGVDFYDARIGGGFPAGAGAPCEVLNGECQAPAPAPPAAQGSATSTFSGPGNKAKTRVKPQKRKGKHNKKNRKGKKHHKRHTTGKSR